LSKEEGMGKSQTDDLLQDMLEEMKEANEKSGTRMIGNRAISEEKIDMEDYLDEPVAFFCYSFSHICLGDTRFGQSVKTPYDKPIRFKPLYRYVKPGNSRNNQEIVSMSCCIIRSKKESKWVQNHSLFGIKYFKSARGVTDINREHSDKLIEVMSMLNGMSQFEVVQRAKTEKIGITEDVDDIKKRLAYHLADKAMQSSSNIKNKTHHKIAAADPGFNPDDPASIREVSMDAGEVEKVAT